MAAITWRNVDRPALSEAMRPLLGAQQSFNASFDTLGQILNRTEQIGNNNVAVGNEVAKQNYLTMLDSAKTPEELAALQKTEEFQNAFNSLNAAGQGQVRTADDARLTALRNQTVQGQDYDTGQTAFAQKDSRDALSGKVALGTATEDEIRAAGLQNSAPLYAALRQGQIAERDRAIKEGQFGLQKNQDNRAAQTSAQQAQLFPGQLTLQSAQVTDTQNKLADTAALRGVDALVQADSAAHQNYVAENGSVINNVATGMGMPMKEGKLNLNALTSDQKKTLDAELSKQGLPLVDDVFGSDTKNMSLTIQKVREQFGPAGVARANQIAPALYSTSGADKIGRDADLAANSSAKYASQLEEAQARYGGISTEANATKILRAAEPMIQSLAKQNGDESKISDYMSALTDKLQNGGIKVGDRRILPSEDAMYGIIRSIKPSMFQSASTELEIAFEKWAKENKDDAAQLYGTTSQAKTRKLDDVKSK